MPNGINAGELATARAAYGHVLVDEAVRQTLIAAEVIGADASMVEVFADADLVARADAVEFNKMVEVLAAVGKPQPLAPARPDGHAVIGATIGIRGNPPGTDHDYTGGWHLAQDNGWDTWVTIAAIATGGFRIYNPATRLTGEHGTAMRGVETTGALSSDGRLHFEVAWQNNSRGAYSCGFDAGELLGDTRDVNIRGSQPVRWKGKRMPLADMDSPPTPHPVIRLDAVPNTADNGFNVTISGRGFDDGVAYEVQGRVVSYWFAGDWFTHATGITDRFGGFSTSFGVFKPFGYRYDFRALADGSGMSTEVGFS